ncbi:MAG TPA: hypothetical protein VGN86_09855 [Pyrinomonadaceae bacterium]|jgi:hypothetical protein|nr:hypothetical protein [Pyrinomonadaceae bacterium]
MQRLSLILALTAIWAFAITERLSAGKGLSAVSAEVTYQRNAQKPQREAGYGSPVQQGRLENTSINESSGMVASRANPGTFWTHNDSGDGPFIYAFDRRGKSRGVWRVSGASARDWEDIAAGPGLMKNRSYLYVGDIGDNSKKRATIEIYRFPEPTIAAEDAVSTKIRPKLTADAETINLRYPDGKHDAETLLVHPVSGDLYVITKEFLGRAGIYKAAAPLDPSRTISLSHIGSLNVPSLLGGFVTGGDISPDGRRVAICDYTQGYEAVIGAGRPFDEIWKQTLNVLELGSRRQGEAIAYRLDGRALLTTSEGVRSPLIEIVRK